MGERAVVVTGANGFIGKALIKLLNSSKRRVLAVTRCQEAGGGCESVGVGDIGPDTQWGEALQDAGCVVHLAGRAHVLQERAADPLVEFRRVNVLGAVRLAQDAAARGVSRFVFISSIGVHGNRNSRPFSEEDPPGPIGPYAVSKLEAEIVLRAIAAETGMEVVIIRPPLVYGPNAPGNFGRLLEVVAKGIPLPLGAVRNKRSFIFLDNLADLIVTCIDHPAAANQVFLAGDGEDLSTPDLLRLLGNGLKKPARLLPVPTLLLEAGAAVIGKSDIVRPLCGSLQVDINKARTILGWNPPVSVDDALRATARHFLETSAQ